MEFKHKCGYGIADIQPECNCYNEYILEKKAHEKHLETLHIMKTLNKVERILNPKYMNDVFTWKHIQDAIKDDSGA